MHRSRLVAALVDVPEADYDATVRFWSGAVGRQPRMSAEYPEYAQLGEPFPGFQLMVQRVGAPARVHLDVETDDVDAEVRRLTALGAAEVRRVKTWVVMRDPAGLPFCVVQVQSPEAFERHAVTWPD